VAGLAEHVARSGAPPDPDASVALMAEWGTVPAPELSDPG
jgi:hypothetical protein